MIILTLRTDKPEAEVGLYDDHEKIAYDTWEAHRALAETLHDRLAKLLKKSQKDWPDLQAIVVYKGPGSFTGIRIGLSVANALAYSLSIPVVGTTGTDWIQTGVDEINGGASSQIALPDYGAPVHITQQKK